MMITYINIFRNDRDQREREMGKEGQIVAGISSTKMIVQNFCIVKSITVVCGPLFFHPPRPLPPPPASPKASFIELQGARKVLF